MKGRKSNNIWIHKMFGMMQLRTYCYGKTRRCQQDYCWEWQCYGFCLRLSNTTLSLSFVISLLPPCSSSSFGALVLNFSNGNYTYIYIYIWSSISNIISHLISDDHIHNVIINIRNPPRFPEAILKESTFKDVASTLHRRINQFLIKIFDIAYGKDLPLFFLVLIN